MKNEEIGHIDIDYAKKEEARLMKQRQKDKPKTDIGEPIISRYDLNKRSSCIVIGEDQNKKLSERE